MAFFRYFIILNKKARMQQDYTAQGKSFPCRAGGIAPADPVSMTACA